MNDIIECSSYNNLMGVSPWGNYKGRQIYGEPPDGSIVWCSTDEVSHLFKLLENSTNKYVLISSCSVLGVAQQCDYPYYDDIAKTYQYVMGKHYSKNPAYYDIQFHPDQFVSPGCRATDTYSVRTYNKTHSTFNDIPNCITSWFMTNSHIREPRIIDLPFGIPEGNTDSLYKVIKNPPPKRGCVYVNLGVDSNPIVREPLLDYFRRSRPAWATIREGGLSREQFYEELASHQFCVCPAGNGPDSYRALESLYCHTIPLIDESNVISKNPAYQNAKLYSSINHIESYSKHPHIVDWNSPSMQLTKLSYWQSQFENFRKKLVDFA